ncbi:MAG TPA: hypothetical protein VGG05_21035 [Pseudonocardiaceae bacterium]
MTDQELLRALAAAFDRQDPVPSAVRRDAERAGALVAAAAGWDALAFVAGDHVRGAGDLLGFADQRCRVDVQVDAHSDGSVRLTGLAEGGAVVVRWPDGERTVEVDDVGRFTVGGLPRGPLCVVVRRPGEPDAVGPWFVG